MRDEQELLHEAMTTQAVRDEAAAQGVDLVGLQAERQGSREAQEKLMRVFAAALKADGTDAETVRRLLES